MPYLKQKGDPARYPVAYDNCIGCKCFRAGMYQVRGATGKGSRNSGESPSCMTNAYHGCPDEEQRDYTEERARERKSEGWSKA